MNPSHLTLVASHGVRAPSPLILGDRRVFWRVFIDWLATASIDDTEALERVLERHAHHVRPLVDAVSDAMLDLADINRLPSSLLLALRAAQWAPVPRAVPDVA